jgi:DUF1680 family protein
MGLAKYSPVTFSNVKINDKFWAPRIEIMYKNTIPITYKHLVNTGRLDAFRLKWKPGMPFEPHVFWDSDVAKWLETVAYIYHLNKDSDLDKLMDEVIALIVSAQQPDGYLNTHFTVVDPKMRFKNMRDWHELYCAGHLIEAAVAHYQATGKRSLLDCLCRYVDYIDSQFGPEEGKRRGYCGHEEVELALMKLYRATSNSKYLKMAQYFVTERGQMPYYFVEEAKIRGEPPVDFVATLRKMEYYQAHAPVQEQDAMVGHAVRANYYYSGVADVADETEDTELKAACERLWNDGTQKKLYITGGIGNSNTNEGFTKDYDLPNETAYAETCAAIAHVFFNHRMLQFDSDGKYADVLERGIYNGTISGVSLDGKKFFYENPLATNPAVRKMDRNDWFGCSCCPNNISRMIATIGGYIYSNNSSEIVIHQYIQSETSVKLEDTSVKISQQSNYPWEGLIQMTISPEKKSKFMVKIRIPGWCKKYTLKVDNIKISDAPINGYVMVIREWSLKNQVTLELDMPVERVYSHPLLLFNSGKVALQRGPIVYCLEEVDNGKGLDQVFIPRDSIITAKFNPNLLGGVSFLNMIGFKNEVKNWTNKLYSTETPERKKVDLTAIPYFAWNNRGVGEMQVWMHEL